jgi:Ca2+-transporting ATPase
LVNRSFYYSIITTANYPNKLVPMIIGLTAILCAVILMIKPARIFFSFELISYKQIGISILVGMISVLWYELVKWAKRNKSNG